MSVPVILTEYADPVWVTQAGIFDCSVQFPLGRQVVACSNPDQELQITNPPNVSSQLREVWVKNMLTVPLNVTSYGPLIDNDHGVIVEANGSVHLIWSINLGKWLVI